MTRKAFLAMLGLWLLAGPVLAGPQYPGVPGNFPSPPRSFEFAISGVQTNYNVGTQQSGSFTRPAERIVLRTDKTITVRFNSATADAITVETGPGLDTAYMWTNILNLFITTTATTNIKIVRVP